MEQGFFSPWDHRFDACQSREFFSLGPPMFIVVCLVPLFSMRTSSRGLLPALGKEVVCLRVCQFQSCLTRQIQRMSEFLFLSLSFLCHLNSLSVSESVNYFSTFGLRLAFRPAPLIADLALLACVCEWMVLIADD